MDRRDAVIALWDGEKSQGRGGTAEIVGYAQGHGVPIAWVRRGDRFAARPSRACTHPSLGRVPDIEARMSAQRPAGTRCITIKNTHQAWTFSPQVTVPGAPAASGGASAA